MYSKPHFKEEDAGTILQFMKDHSFATLIATGSDGKPEATQIPLLIHSDAAGKIRLTGHVSKKSGHHLAMQHSKEALVLFTGAHTYVSASWYKNDVSASTWNYLSVHARGPIIFRDEAGTREAVKELTEKYEAPGQAAAFDRLPEEYINSLVKAIDAFDIWVDKLEHVFKLSQNRSRESRENIITELHNRSDEDSRRMARELEKRIQEPQK